MFSILAKFKYIKYCRLQSLSMAANQIKNIEARAFKPVHRLTKLSLQDNQISILTTNEGEGMKY